MSEFAVILVFSTSHAIHAERVLKRAGIDVQLVPTPRHLSSDCGSAVRISRNDMDRCQMLIEKSDIEIDRIESLAE